MNVDDNPVVLVPLIICCMAAKLLIVLLFILFVGDNSVCFSPVLMKRFRPYHYCLQHALMLR